MDKKKEAQQKKSAYQQKADAQLKELEARINLWRAKAEQATADVKIRYQDQLEKLTARQSQVEAQLQQLREAGAEAWEKARSGVEGALNELRTAVDQAASTFV